MSRRAGRAGQWPPRRFAELGARERLLLGRRLAVEHGATLRAHYAAVPATQLVPLGGDSAPGILETLLALQDDQRRRAREAFDDVLRQPGPAVTWSQAGDLAPAREFARAATYGDLIPYAGQVAGAFATVAVAWKETPEAARAVAAALPFLRRAASVHILAWGAEPQGGNLPRLAAYLALHGVRAERHHEPPEGASHSGEAILSRRVDLSADLLVMGCYGHGRSREWILGGASRTVLQSMTLPVLMAH